MNLFSYTGTANLEELAVFYFMDEIKNIDPINDAKVVIKKPDISIFRIIRIKGSKRPKTELFEYVDINGEIGYFDKNTSAVYVCSDEKIIKKLQKHFFE
jgi:hypothetical protein